VRPCGWWSTIPSRHILLGWLLGKGADLRESMQTHLLTGVLLDNSSSPLRHALETTALGTAPSELCGADDSTREMTFVCGLEGSDPKHAEAVEELVMGVIRRVAEEGVAQEMVESVLHQLELAQREIHGGRVPYGLRLMVNALSPTLHGGDPAAFLNIDPVLRELRESITDPDFLPGLARRLLLANPHRVRVVMAPDPALGARMAEDERRRLATRRAAMDEAERQAVLDQARALQARQLQRDDAGLLPKVGLEDVPPDMRVVEGESEAVAGMPATWFGQGTNGLVYGQVVVDLPPLPEPLLDLLPLFCDCVTEVGCGERDYLAAQAWQAALTGGISADTSVRAAVGDVSRAQGYFVLAGKALVRNGRGLAQVLREVFERARFDELPRLRELVAQLRGEREMSVTDHGHFLAMAAACAGMSPAAALVHRWSGLLGLRQLKSLDDALQDDGRLGEFAAGLTQIRDAVLEAPRRLLLVGEPARRESFVTALGAEWKDIAEVQGEPARFNPPGAGYRVQEAWAVNTQVGFCARAYPTVPVEHEDAAALSVLGNFLTNGFLHRAVREQGGAYGAGAGYDSDAGAFRFYSYRDPRLEETLSDFDRAVRWLREETHEPRELEEAILGLIAAIDRPESPAGEAVKAFFGDLHGRTVEQRRRFRQRVLGVSLDDLIRVGEQWLDPSRASTAVVGQAGTLQASAGGLGLEMKRF
jgi:Zn-dependent M16 (insulinase) family peptidase